MINKEAVNKLKYIRRIYPSKNIENVEADVALDMAIKALEQEPKTDVLDKIRAEIETEIGTKQWEDYDYCSGLIKAKRIIDKYKTESEK